MDIRSRILLESMKISIVNIAIGEIVENKKIRVENLILARYPLLESLPTKEQKSILELFDCGYLAEGSYLRSIGIGRI